MKAWSSAPWTAEEGPRQRISAASARLGSGAGEGSGWTGAGIAGTGAGSGAVTWGIYPCMYWGACGHSAAGTGSMGLSAPPERVTRPHTRSKISRSLPQSPGPGCGI